MKPTEFNKKKQMEAIKSRGKPLGGAPEVKIPPLDAEPIVGKDGSPMTMEEMAEQLRDPRNPLSPMYDPTLAKQSQMDPQQLRAQRQGPPTKSGPFGPVLDNEATKDPSFRPGIGSMYAANQPGLKRQKGTGPLSPETLQSLEAINEFQQTAEQAQKEEAQQTLEEKSQTKDFVEEMGLDGEFFDKMRTEQDRLSSPELKEAIESRLQTMDVVDIILHGEVTQDVPIIRDKLVITFRTISGDEDLEIKRLMGGERTSDLYVYDKLNMMQLTAGLHAINHDPLPSHRNDKGDFDKDLFTDKFKRVTRYAVQMLASLAINFTWFDQRARELFVDLGPVKNG